MNNILEIDKRKLKIEAMVIADVRRLFRNMSKDAENLYKATGRIPAKELANNYYSEFLKEIRDIMRRSIKEFGFDLRSDLEKKGFLFDVEFKKRLLDVEKKISVTDYDLNRELEEINNSFLKESTFFIANESERQAMLITETNAKEIELAIRQEEIKFTKKAFSPEERSIIARNIYINLLDKKDARSDLIASQIVGMSEAWSRQTEAEIVNDSQVFDKVTKTWFSILDMKTRGAHVSADQQQVEVNDYFNVNGERLKSPRDPNGSAGNIINCRCIATYDANTTKSLFSLEIKSDQTFKPTEEMANICERALEWRKKYGRGGTLIGVARANQIKNRENLSLTTVKRMYSFFSRHGNYRSTHYEFRDGEPTTWRIAWDLWGSDAGRDWAKKILGK